MRVWAILAAILATVLAGWGALMLSNATTGVGVIALGCFVAIGARLMQASAHQRRLEAVIAKAEVEAAAKQARLRETYVRPENIEQLAKDYGVSGR